MNTLNFPVARIAHAALIGAALALLSACNQAPPSAAPAADATPPPAAAPAAEAPAPAPTPAAAPTEVKKAVKKAHASSGAANGAGGGSGSTASAMPAPPRTPLTVCSNCGVIESITPVKEEGKGTALGAVAGGLAGLVVGNQVGGGNGKTIAKIAGAAGGAYLGNKIEKKVRATTHYDIKVRLDNGTEQTVSQDNEPTLAVGAAVQIVDGTVVAK